MQRFSKALIAFTSIVLILHFLFFWMNFAVDSYYYWASGHLFKTGVFLFDIAFMPTFAKPPTVTPPAYGVVLMVLETFPAPDVLLHFLQLLLLCGTGYFVYRILRLFFTNDLPIVVACIFILIPGNLVYSSLILTEIGAEFLIALFTFCIIHYVKTKNISSLAAGVAIGYAMTMWKYGFVLFGIFASLLFILDHQKKLKHYMIASTGILLVICWVVVNYRITGVWGLSNYRGIRLWNQIIYEGKVLPHENIPSMRELRTYVPMNVDIYKPYYEAMYLILPQVGFDLSQTDRIMGNVAMDAVREHPLVFLGTALRLFWQLHEPGTPFWEDTFLFESPKYSQYCGKLGVYKMCNPIVKLPVSTALWDTYLKFSKAFYYSVFPAVAMLLFIPSLLFLLLRGNRIERILVMLYGVGITPIIFFEHLDRRYIVPFYPLMVLILVFSLRKILSLRGLKSAVLRVIPTAKTSLSSLR